ncbi:MAG: hypothetical protein ABFC24_03365 [Methanoregulaceae archaeon]
MISAGGIQRTDNDIVLCIEQSEYCISIVPARRLGDLGHPCIILNPYTKRAEGVACLTESRNDILFWIIGWEKPFQIPRQEFQSIMHGEREQGIINRVTSRLSVPA